MYGLPDADQPELKAIFFDSPGHWPRNEFDDVLRVVHGLRAHVLCGIRYILERRAQSDAQPTAIELVNAEIRLGEPGHAGPQLKCFWVLRFVDRPGIPVLAVAPEVSNERPLVPANLEPAIRSVSNDLAADRLGQDRPTTRHSFHVAL